MSNPARTGMGRDYAPGRNGYVIPSRIDRALDILGATLTIKAPLGVTATAEGVSERRAFWGVVGIGAASAIVAAFTRALLRQ